MCAPGLAAVWGNNRVCSGPILPVLRRTEGEQVAINVNPAGAITEVLPEGSSADHVLIPICQTLTPDSCSTTPCRPHLITPTQQKDQQRPRRTTWCAVTNGRSEQLKACPFCRWGFQHSHLSREGSSTHNTEALFTMTNTSMRPVPLYPCGCGRERVF